MSEDDVRQMVRDLGRGGQSELALLAGVRPAFICDIMHGRRRPSRKVLNALDLTRSKTISYVYAKKGACTTEKTGA